MCLTIDTITDLVCKVQNLEITPVAGINLIGEILAGHHTKETEEP